MEDATNSLTQLIVNAGVIGTISIILLVGCGYLLYIFGSKLTQVADRFVTGTLDNMGKMVSQMDNHGNVMKEISITQKEIQKTQERLVMRVEDLHKK